MALQFSDVISRFGGDEFVIVLPDMKADAAGGRMLAVSALASEVGKKICGEELLSASIGVASWPDDGANADDLLAEADRRMYAHKQQQKQRLSVGIEGLTLGTPMLQ